MISQCRSVFLHSDCAGLAVCLVNTLCSPAVFLHLVREACITFITLGLKVNLSLCTPSSRMVGVEVQLHSS
jgi:hypothetical protein